MEITASYDSRNRQEEQEMIVQIVRCVVLLEERRSDALNRSQVHPARQIESQVHLAQHFESQVHPACSNAKRNRSRTRGGRGIDPPHILNPGCILPNILNPRCIRPNTLNPGEHEIPIILCSCDRPN
jgi:hypothetical protein